MQPHPSLTPSTTILRHACRTTALIIALLILCPAPSGAQAPANTRNAPARDSLRNGTLIGAGVGFATGFLALAAFNAKETASGPIWDSEALGYYTTAGFLGAGIGAALGAIIDAVRRDEHSPFATKRLAIRPVLGKDRRGIAASVKF